MDVGTAIDSGSAAGQVTEAALRLLADISQPDAASPLETIVAARQLSAAAAQALRIAVGQARDTGHSWSDIGEVLGTSRQAAFQRFGRPEDPRTGLPMPRAVPSATADHAIALVVDLVEGRWQQVCRDFNERMAAEIDAARIAEVAARLSSTVGRYEQMGEPFGHWVGDIAVVEVPLYFEAGEVTASVSYDDEGKVAGLFLRPPA